MVLNILPAAPDCDMVRQRAGAKIEAFKELVFPDGYDPGAKAPAKRKVRLVLLKKKQKRKKKKTVNWIMH